MRTRAGGPCRTATAFTLVELLVSMVIIALLLFVLVSITNSTGKTWSYTTSKIAQFREAREAFEAITRRMSQAVLNTYWDYQYPNNDSTKPPTAYVRQSELRFVSGDTATLGITGNRPTHAVFFQAPLGYVNGNASYSELTNLLNTWGYCIEFSDDSNLRPPFLANMTRPPALRNRFRLIELLQPSQGFTLYSLESGTAGGNVNYAAKTWFSTPLGTVGVAGRPVRVLADNIVALILLPKLSPHDEALLPNPPASPGTALSPTYVYDSTLTYNGTTAPTAANAPFVDPKNQLPPVIQVTMVAVDEPSYARFQGASTAMPVSLGLQNLFTPATGVGSLTDPTQPGYAQDLQTLEATLQTTKLNYRVFTTEVSLKAAKWSRDETN